MLVVQKFGGSSLADAERLNNAAQKVAQQVDWGNQVIVVVSAQGDTTDEMLEKLMTREPNPRELDAYLACGEQQSAALMTMALQDRGIKAISLTGWQTGLQTDSHHTDARICHEHPHVRDGRLVGRRSAGHHQREGHRRRVEHRGGHRVSGRGYPRRYHHPGQRWLRYHGGGIGGIFKGRPLYDLYGCGWSL